MGNSRALRHACAVAAIVGLTGCNPPAKQSETADLRNRVTALEARIVALEQSNATLVEENKIFRQTLDENAKRLNQNFRILSGGALTCDDGKRAC